MAGARGDASAFLQSPNFLYLTEVGAPDPAEREPLPLHRLRDGVAALVLPDQRHARRRAARRRRVGRARHARRACRRRRRGCSRCPRRTTPCARSSRACCRSTTSTRSRARSQLFPQFTPTLGAAMKQETLLGHRRSGLRPRRRLPAPLRPARDVRQRRARGALRRAGARRAPASRA